VDFSTVPACKLWEGSLCLGRNSVRSQEASPQMIGSFLQFRTLDELRDFVYETFCEHYQLQIGAFHMTEQVLRRGGKPCGIYFCLHGPRAVRFTAIWETESNQVLFYGSTGERFQKLQLSTAPDFVQKNNTGVRVAA